MYRFNGDIATLDFLRYDVTNLAYASATRAAPPSSASAADATCCRPICSGSGRDRRRTQSHFHRLADTISSATTTICRPARHALLVDEAAAGSPDHRAIRSDRNEHRRHLGRHRRRRFSLSENGLYTVEGWKHFLDALTPNGVLTVRGGRPAQDRRDRPAVQPRRDHVAGRGVDDPEAQHLPRRHTILATIIVGNSPLTADELGATTPGYRATWGSSVGQSRS